MRLLPRAFRARVARRVVGLFVLSALVPVAAMATVSFFAVHDQLDDNSRERLGQLTRNAGQSILQQLRSVETTMRAARTRWSAGLPTGMAATIFSPTVLTLSVSREDGTMRPLLGEPRPRAPLDAGELERLATDLMILRVDPARPERVEAALPLDADAPMNGMLWADLLADSLWSSAETFASLPTVVDFCVLASGSPLHCTSGENRFPDAYAARRGEERAGAFDLTDEGSFIVGHWSFYPASNFDAAPWSVLIAEDAAAVHAPLDGFSTTFALALLFAILLVLLLSNIQIRRTLEPLSALEAGTARVAVGDLDARVTVTTADEFGSLAASFNAMATRLKAQFTQFEAIHAVGHAALAGMAKEDVVVTALKQLPAIYPGRSAAVMSVAGGAGGREGAHIHWLTRGSFLGGTQVDLGPDDHQWLGAHLRGGVATGPWPPFVAAARRGLGAGPLVVFPHVVKGRIDGATLVELARGVEAMPDESADRLRHIVDQIAVALDDVRLVDELEALSWGALVAFARAIDAKSEWTAGHSERVTEMALGLARELGFDQDDMDVLHRGGLLHDIGKIGVPNSILNKAEGLTPEEVETVRLHPVVGARILSPIPAFATALPLVRSHHESWDGTGYPDGLTGEEIHPLARILAVADAYDAMASPRPYRSGQSPHVVLQAIREESGKQFEPRVVDALIAYLDRHEIVASEASRHGVA